MDAHFPIRRLTVSRVLFLIVAIVICSHEGISQDRPADETARSAHFFDAIRAGNLDQVQKLIDSGIDVNLRDGGGSTPLINAASYKQTDILKLLILSGADVKAEHFLNGTALHEAASRGPAEAVEELLKAGSDVHSDASRYGPTPLHCAANSNNAERVKLLLQAGAKVDSDEMTPLTCACRQAEGEHTAAIKLLIDAKSNLNPVGDSPLHWARCPAVTKMLIDAGADVNHRNEDGQTPLHMGPAPHWGPREEELKLMVAAGADVNARDNEKSTPLLHAVWNNFPKEVQFLIEAGADVDARDANGNTPLSVANLLHLDTIAKQLEDAGAKDDGQTLLGQAAAKGDVQQVEKLLESGSSVDERGSESKTPLHLAAEKDRIEVARVLIAAKANVNCLDVHGFTPLHLATSKLMAQALLDAGAETDPQPPSELGTPLFVAATEGRIEVIPLILDHSKHGIPKDLVVWVTFYGRVEVLQYMLSRGASPNASQPLLVAAGGSLADMQCPEHVTAETRFNMAKLLIESGAKVNAISSVGYFDKFTALHAAASTGEVEMIKLLIEHKANPNAAGAGEYFAGVTPLHLAAKGGHADATKILLDAGAAVNAKTGNPQSDASKTSLDFASTPEVRKLLIERGAK